VRHLLAPGTASQDPVQLVEGMVALHATDPATVYLSAVARMPKPDHAALEGAQYERGRLVRILAMRRTMFLITAEAAPMVQAAAADDIARQVRRRYGQLIEQAGLASDGSAWLESACLAALDRLLESGEMTGAELGRATPILQTKINLAEGKNWGATINLTGWVTTVLAAEGRILRGRPLGSWTGNQYRWRIAEHPPAPPDPARREAARSELVRRWLARFGPATVADVQWWTGWTLGETRRALAGVEVADVDIDGGPGILLASDVDPVASPGSWAALLPALDPTPMGWKGRAWYMGDHSAALFDRSGNVGPTVWTDGRVVGGWAQRNDGEVVFRLLEDVGREGARQVAESAARMQAAIGDKRITPKFRTPLEKELSS
jgi:hypothetical protein